ncbi:MAG: class I SAM-dependent methyltransferase [Usitatibacteraceae bacterium]
MYSEEQDFAEKRHALVEMHARLERAGISRDFAKANVLEIGGAGGVLAGLLCADVKRIIVSDIVDHQALYDGQFPQLLKEKFFRNDADFSLQAIEFQVADATDLPYRDELFDLVVSFNAFEHIPDPLSALREAFRVAKWGGVIYLTFDPIWTADTGNHFSSIVREPWRHLLCSEDDFCKEMSIGGATEDQISDFRFGLNRRQACMYRDEFPALLSSLGVTRVHCENWSGCVLDSNVDHPNRFNAARLLGCPPEDLLIRGFTYCITK